MYRYGSEESPAMWKERGTGEVKILFHNIKKTARVVMRRDKTLKICANHFSEFISIDYTVPFQKVYHCKIFIFNSSNFGYEIM